MTWKGFAVDKLAAKEVLVTYVKAAEGWDLSPVFTTASTLVTNTMLHPGPAAFEYHCRKAVYGFRLKEETRSWQTNGDESRANGGQSFCWGVSEMDVPWHSPSPPHLIQGYQLLLQVLWTLLNDRHDATTVKRVYQPARSFRSSPDVENIC